MNFDAVLAEAGVACFDGWPAEIGHRKAPLTIRRATSDDEAATRFWPLYHGAGFVCMFCEAQHTPFSAVARVFLLDGRNCGHGVFDHEEIRQLDALIARG